MWHEISSNATRIDIVLSHLRSFPRELIHPQHRHISTGDFHANVPTSRHYISNVLSRRAAIMREMFKNRPTNYRLTVGKRLFGHPYRNSDLFLFRWELIIVGLMDVAARRWARGLLRTEKSTAALRLNSNREISLLKGLLATLKANSRTRSFQIPAER